ncbi:hypothetical protein ACFFQF_23575 [Haladaptatus pallidirubidus]|uniref:DUF7344 domain-containing protein n=1 Tax=Haladaptatus pallidirubidus TaxID=1008152 RepID=A0AAV3UNG5_9EURY|nr:hypothetical protein [Haladaptatus pallidirubidus]
MTSEPHTLANSGTGVTTAVSALTTAGYDGSLNLLFDALSDKRRRYALYCLNYHQTPMALADLATEIARYEYDADTRTEIPDGETKSIYTTLHHNHLPRLAEANLVMYDSTTHTAELTPNVPELNWDDLV